ncbi:Protein-methionine-sulfoxide reductase heme-binding subunit MsrQ [Halomicronema hongdechloris C2206]|uniref:Protein-methionine-sulfoxide reductase heme-binding subunit MsrQ n=1 Tax=Halomicronema hongdechloris C2206 TaxID=1641165 RepID=A0A1Z3HKT2_9CYAN|nr:sulfite exporter TauE/SafE family protein [Halomicronema hongdechloris]ASC70921.1 Protein-methionine-sulfoxide reductase heme-binding subunit MsrQ [Halomicronema hongdechloris C2206]
MLDWVLIASLGFLGSFGHCVGMCGPLAVAFSLSREEPSPSPRQTLAFHGLLNLGRLLSYGLVGLAIGGLGSVVVASGHLAGVGSSLRQVMALITGGLLIWMGLHQISPQGLPALPLLHPLRRLRLHDRLSQLMTQTAQTRRWWTPLLLGLAWGLIPCGFLYAAQIKAAETGSIVGGAITMLAFGSGTLPTMVGVGMTTSWLSQDQRSQLFQMGGWITLLVGVLTLMRSGDTMTDYAGYGAILCLGLALIARPIRKLWAVPYRYRRLLGVGAFVLALAHTLHMLDHSWQWNWQALAFMLPHSQGGMVAGALALLLMVPLVLTSNDKAQRQLGRLWRHLHLLSIPVLLFCTVHCWLAGSSYLGRAHIEPVHWLHTAALGLIVLGIFLVRSHRVWHWLGLGKFYAPPRP